MDSFHEPSLLLDPTSHLDPNFLSFSSFGDLSPVTNFSSSFWERPLSSDSYNPKSIPPSDASGSDTSSPSNLYAFNSGGISSFEPSTPAGDIGIFHTPVKASSSSTVDPSSSSSCRTSASSDWGVPVTPKHSEPVVVSTPGFSWDDFSTGSSSSLVPSTIAPTTCATVAPLRVASNPTLSAAARTPTVKQVSSMPALKEDPFVSSSESTPIDFSYADVQNGSTELADELEWAFGQYNLGGDQALDDTIFSAFNEPIDRTKDEAIEMTVPELTISASTMDQELVTPGVIQPEPMGDLSWVPVATESSTQAVFDSNAFSSIPSDLRPTEQVNNDTITTTTITTTQDKSNDANNNIYASTYTPSFTINPMSFMTNQQPERPLSAPGNSEDAPSVSSLNIPVANMGRSLSTNAVPLSKQNLTQHDILYASPSGPLYAASETTYPLAGQYPRALPVNTNAGQNPMVPGGIVGSRPLPQLQVQINTDQNFGSYMPAGVVLSPTPQSASIPTEQAGVPMPMQQPLPLLSPQPTSNAMSSVGMSTFHMMPTTTPQAGGLSARKPVPVAMARAGTQPLPKTRKLSTGMPAHLARAQAIVQMQEAQMEAERQAIQRDAASRRVNMAQASVMQPTISMPGLPSHTQSIMGWEGPSAQTGALPVLTTAPLVTIHPPPMAYYSIPRPGGVVTPHRIHPPPYVARPIANLPSPSKRRASPSSALPMTTSISASGLSTPSNATPKTPNKQRSPSSKRKVSPSANKGGGFSWSGATFINFTSDDAEKILTGVAPSGSQSKRKREEAAAAGAAIAIPTAGSSYPSGKRARSD